MIRTVVLGLLVLALADAALAQGRSIILQSTTSTANSGLYDHLLPIFEEKTGIQVHVVAVGTGQAIGNARNCDGDLLLVHDREAEQAFVAAGFGTKRADLMYNDFVIVGPADDPARIRGVSDATEALSAIAAAGALFVSRGDASGTHRKEVALWARTGIDPTEASGDWYRETGAGMGATLNAAIGMGAYVLTDRATWISFGNRQDFEILVGGDDALFNQYGVIPVSPDRCPDVRADDTRVFADWLISAEGQGAIAAFRVDGQQLFFPNAPRE